MIGSAKSEGELLELVQRYCAAWFPSDLINLPGDCPECSPKVVDDIPVLALAFKRAELAFAGPDDAAGLLHEVTGVLASASEQLRAIRAHRPIPAWRPHRTYYGPT